MKQAVALCLAVAMVAGQTAFAASDPVKLAAAGSLKAALSEVVTVFTARSGVSVETSFAASGLLRERIMNGEQVDVFTSANLQHPQAIAAERGGTVQSFATNRLCAIARPGLALQTETFLEQLLDPGIRVGTSTPKADPSGDYAWELFDRAETIRPGAAETLKAKALQLTGGADSAKPDIDRSVYGWVMENDKADIFLTYCTNAVVAAEQVAGLQVVEIPDELSVGATYGLLLSSERPEAAALAELILSLEGQAILQKYGFGPP